MSNLTEKMRNVLALAEAAKDMGASAAAPVLAGAIMVDPRVRLKCRLNVCGQYGRNLMCPPHVWEVADTAAAINRYTFALLAQITAPADMAESRQVFDREKTNMNEIIVALEREAFRLGFSLAMGLSAGHCQLCAVCAGVEGGRACRRPDRARPSMEATGIDVTATCAAAGLATGFVPGRVTVTGLLLID